jgi:chromosome segregation ATPase
MSGPIIRRLRPEEEEVSRKRAELAAIQAALGDRELELVDLRGQLAAFEGRYLRQVGALYAELDEWRARVSELRAQLDPSAAANERAKQARAQARQTYEDAHSQVSEVQDFIPSTELKALFREAAKRVHPDFAKDSADLERRTRFMTEANRAYRAGDAEALQRILDDYQDGEGVTQTEKIGAELVRLIRQISLARERIIAIERELDDLRRSEVSLLRKQAEESEQKGRDLLSDLAAAVRKQIEEVKSEHQVLIRSMRPAR